MTTKQINSLIPIVSALALVIASVVGVVGFINSEIENRDEIVLDNVTDVEYVNTTVPTVVLTVRVTARDEGQAEGAAIVKDGRTVGRTGTDGELRLVVETNQTYQIGAIFPEGYERDGRNYDYEDVVVGTTDRAVFFTMVAVE